MMCLGQYQAYVCAGKTREEKYARLLEAPEAMRKQIIDHVKTVVELKNKAALKEPWKQWR